MKAANATCQPAKLPRPTLEFVGISAIAALVLVWRCDQIFETIFSRRG